MMKKWMISIVIIYYNIYIKKKENKYFQEVFLIHWWIIIFNKSLKSKIKFITNSFHSIQKSQSNYEYYDSYLKYMDFTSPIINFFYNE